MSKSSRALPVCPGLTPDPTTSLLAAVPASVGRTFQTKRKRGGRAKNWGVIYYWGMYRSRSQGLCKSEMLRNISIVLFLNKCDELEHKLALGLRVEEFVHLSSKREAGSDVESVKTCECAHTQYSVPTPPGMRLLLSSPSAKRSDGGRGEGCACVHACMRAPRPAKPTKGPKVETTGLSCASA